MGSSTPVTMSASACSMPRPRSGVAVTMIASVTAPPRVTDKYVSSRAAGRASSAGTSEDHFS